MKHSVEKILDIENLYDPQNIETLHRIQQALKAHALFKNEVDYVVNDVFYYVFAFIVCVSAL